jgi:polyhydroxyalkanoate synthesis regulator phasin
MTYTVYRATNTTNSKSYIGVDSDWPTARMTHESARGDTDIFHRALRQYGPQLFRWEALLHTDDFSEANELVWKMYKDVLAPAGYNTKATLANMPWPTREIGPDEVVEGGIDAGEEIRQILMIDVGDMAPEKAQEVIEEAKETIRKGAITEDGRRRISEAVSKPVTIEGIVYRSIKEAAEKLELPRHQVKMVLKGTNSVEYYRKKNAEAQAGK